MDIAGVPSRHIDWDASNRPETWRKFKLHVDLMLSGPFKKKGGLRILLPTSLGRR